MAKTDYSKYIVPLAIVGGVVYLAPEIKGVFKGVGGGVTDAAVGAGAGVGTGIRGIGTGVSNAAVGAGTGFGTAASGVGSGVSRAAGGLGSGVRDLGLGAGNIFKATGNAGSNVIDSAGSFGSKIFDFGESVINVPDAAVDRIGSGIRNFELPNVSQSFGFLRTAASNASSAINPFSSVVDLGKKGISKVKDLIDRDDEPARSSSSSSRNRSSSSSSSSRIKKANEEKEEINYSPAKTPIANKVGGGYIYAEDLEKPKKSIKDLLKL